MRIAPSNHSSGGFLDHFGKEDRRARRVRINVPRDRLMISRLLQPLQRFDATSEIPPAHALVMRNNDFDADLAPDPQTFLQALHDTVSLVTHMRDVLSLIGAERSGDFNDLLCR